MDNITRIFRIYLENCREIRRLCSKFEPKNVIITPVTLWHMQKLYTTIWNGIGSKREYNDMYPSIIHVLYTITLFTLQILKFNVLTHYNYYIQDKIIFTKNYKTCHVMHICATLQVRVFNIFILKKSPTHIQTQKVNVNKI